MLNTDLYTVASGPSASGDLTVPDPSAVQGERLIAENLVDSGERVSQLNPGTNLRLYPEQLAEIEAWLPNEEAAKELFGYP